MSRYETSQETSKRETLRCVDHNGFAWLLDCVGVRTRSRRNTNTMMPLRCAVICL